MYTLTWIEAAVPAALQVRPVYGFIYGPDGRILLQDDEVHHNLPGGKLEDGESLTKTLTRLPEGSTSDYECRPPW